MTYHASRWYYGWNIVAAATLVTLVTVGMRMGVGPFFLPITEDLKFSRSLLGTIVAVGMLFYGIGMPLAGYLVARRGTRFVLLLGTSIVFVAIIWAVNATSSIGFMLSFGVLLSTGLAFASPVAMTPVIARWFTRRRGMALFFLSTGSMAGIAIMTPLFTLSIEAIGWKSTLLVFGALFAVLTVPMALLVIRDDAPEQTDTQIDSSASRSTIGLVSDPAAPLLGVMKTRPFWQVCFGLFACGFSMNLLGTHGMPMLMDHGFDSVTSSVGIGLIGLVAIFSTIGMGRLADVLQRRNILSLIYLLRGLGFFALLIVGTHWELYVAASVGGLVWAGSLALSSAILADVYGVRVVGLLYGWAYLGHQIGATISSWLGGWAYERFGTHWIAFGSAGVLLLCAALVSYRLPAQRMALASA